MASINIRVLSFIFSYSLHNNSGVLNNWEGAVENFLKISNQKGWNKWGVSKTKAMYSLISYFHIFFQILRRTLENKIVNNLDLT